MIYQLDKRVAEKMEYKIYPASDSTVCTGPCIFDHGSYLEFWDGKSDYRKWSPSSMSNLAIDLFIDMRNGDCVRVDACYKPHGTAYICKMGEGASVFVGVMGHSDDGDERVRFCACICRCWLQYKVRCETIESIKQTREKENLN